MGKLAVAILNRVAEHYKSCAVTLGLLLACALPPFYHVWVLPIVFGGLVWLANIYQMVRKLSAIGYWFGFGFFVAGFYWIGNALLVDVQATGWLYPIVLLLNGGFFGIFTILPLVMTKFGRTVLAKILLMAGMWILSAEWLRSFLLTGFPWNPLSSVLSFNPVWLQTLGIFGTYGLSGILILISSLPMVWILGRCKCNVWAPLMAILLVVAMWGYGEYKMFAYKKFGDLMIPLSSGEELIKVRLVQPSIPQLLKWDEQMREDNFANYVALSKEADLSDIDFVVWGETASSFDLTYDEKHRLQAAESVPPEGYLIAGLLRFGYTGLGWQPYNSLAVINSEGLVVDTYDKSHLVPFGEYIPLRQYLPQWVRPVANTVAEFGRGLKYQTIALEGYPEFAPLICYEVIFSDEVVRKTDKPSWLVVLTNDGWYGISAGPYQHLAAAQMRAVEEGVSVVRSANSGISAVINPFGVITAKLGLAEHGYVDGIVNPNWAKSHCTLFGRLGNIIPLCLAFILIAFGLLFARSKKL